MGHLENSYVKLKHYGKAEATSWFAMICHCFAGMYN